VTCAAMDHGGQHDAKRGEAFGDSAPAL
jgi:hypothetical protein